MTTHLEFSSRSAEITPVADLRPVVHRMTICLVALTAVILGLVLADTVFLVHYRPLAADSSLSAHLAIPEVWPGTGGRGPWGDIEIQPIKICPPVELLRASAPVVSGETVWYWCNTDRLKLSAQLATLDLSGEVRAELLGLAHDEASIAGLTMRPSREFLRKLKPKQRSEIYTALSNYPANADQGLAFRFLGPSLEKWLEGMAVPPRILWLLEPLIYRHGDYLFFADLRQIEGAFSSPEERLHVIRALSRESTYLVSLKVTPESDVAALVDYWGRGGRGKDVRPLIEALANIQGGHKMSIAYLLPPFARDRLFTFPVPAESVADMKRDCHWTALNFFSKQPDDRFCNPAEVLRALTHDYYRVYSNPLLGDVVEFVDETGNARHAAVYIADDFVFTKNGVSSSRPWMLMRLGELKSYYPTRKPLQVLFYRPNNL
jgi:hypothetical protein